VPAEAGMAGWSDGLSELRQLVGESWSQPGGPLGLWALWFAPGGSGRWAGTAAPAGGPACPWGQGPGGLEPPGLGGVAGGGSGGPAGQSGALRSAPRCSAGTFSCGHPL